MRVISHSKKTFSTLFILLCLMLVMLPFIASFQDFLTRLVMHFKLYRAFQDLVVPYELKILATLLNIIHIHSRAGHSYLLYLNQHNRPEVIFLAWNCIGWQSFVLLLITLLSGLTGNFGKINKLEALIIGILGTYLVNIVRLTLVVVVYYLASRGFGVIFHNYFSNLLSIFWLAIFWWIAYSFVLEPKTKSNLV